MATVQEMIKMRQALAATFVGVLTFGCMLAAPAAIAGPDDAKWVAQCVSDNKEAKVAVAVITKYCTCMNDKMSDSETLSITQWEKTHATERAACDKEAGLEIAFAHVSRGRGESARPRILPESRPVRRTVHAFGRS